MIQDLTLAQSLQQRTSEFNVPPGALLSAQNCRQNKNGALTKRPGNSKLTNQVRVPGGGATSIDVSLGGALSAYRNQLLLSCNAGSAAFNPAFGTFGSLKPGNEALLTVVPSPTPTAINAKAVSGQPLYSMTPAVTTDGAYYFYCWVDNTSNLFATIQHIATGDIVQNRIAIAAGANNVLWAIPILVGTQLTIVYHQSTGVVSMAAMGAPYTGSFAAPVVLNTGVGTGGLIDAVTVNSNLFAVSELVSTTGVTLKTFDATGANVGSIASPITAANVQETRLAYGFGTLWMMWRITSSTTCFIESFNPIGATIAATMTGPLAVDTSTNTMACAAVSATRAAVAYTRAITTGGIGVLNTQATLVDNTLSAGAGGFVITSDANVAAQCSLASKPFVQGGKYYCWVQAFSYTAGSLTATQWGVSNKVQWTNILVDLRLDTGTSGVLRPLRPVAVDSPRFAYPYGYNGGANFAAQAAPLSIVSPAANQWVAPLGLRETNYVARYPLIKANFSASQRWKSVTIGTLALVSSGMVLNFDGERFIENGFTTHLSNVTSAGGAATGLVANGLYWYAVVPVTADIAGNVHRGIPSTNSLQLTGGQNSATLTMTSLMVTDRVYQDGSTSAYSYATYYEVYRSQANPSGSGAGVATNFVDIVLNNQGNQVTTYTDTVPDTTIANNALLYTFGGALPNGCPPGALDIVAHQGRAFTIADDGTNIYFSKQIVDGEAVNFTDSFTLPADTTLTALASMDEKMVAFGLRKIFYLIGDGPNDDGSQGYASGLQPIQSDVGCIDRRSVVSTDVGVFFQSAIGIYLLDRGLQVSYIGQPIADELAAFPVVVAAVLHATQPWIYFYVTNAAGNAGERLVYDYRVQQWYVDTLPGVPLSATNTDNGSHYWLDTTGQVWNEDATGAVYTDNAAWVTMKFETAWNPTNPTKLGFAGVDKIQLLAKKLSPCDATVSWRENYQPSVSQSVVYFDNTQQSQPKLPTVEVEFAATPGKQEAFTVLFQDYAPTGGATTTGQGWQVEGISCQISPIDDPAEGKLNRLTPAQRGQHLT